MTPDSNTLPRFCQEHPVAARIPIAWNRYTTDFAGNPRYYCGVCCIELAPPAQEAGTAQCRHQS